MVHMTLSLMLVAFVGGCLLWWLGCKIKWLNPDADEPHGWRGWFYIAPRILFCMIVFGLAAPFVIWIGLTVFEWLVGNVLWNLKQALGG